MLWTNFYSAIKLINTSKAHTGMTHWEIYYMTPPLMWPNRLILNRYHQIQNPSHWKQNRPKPCNKNWCSRNPTTSTTCTYLFFKYEHEWKVRKTRTTKAAFLFSIWKEHYHLHAVRVRPKEKEKKSLISDVPGLKAEPFKEAGAVQFPRIKFGRRAK